MTHSFAIGQKHQSTVLFHSVFQGSDLYSVRSTCGARHRLRPGEPVLIGAAVNPLRSVSLRCHANLPRSQKLSPLKVLVSGCVSGCCWAEAPAGSHLTCPTGWNRNRFQWAVWPMPTKLTVATPMSLNQVGTVVCGYAQGILPALPPNSDYIQWIIWSYSTTVVVPVTTAHLSVSFHSLNWKIWLERSRTSGDLWPSSHVIGLTGHQCSVEAGLQHVSSQGSHMFSSQHGHLLQWEQAQLQGHHHAGPGPPHQLPRRRLDAGLQPELSCVRGDRPHPWDARQCHYENLWYHLLLTFWTPDEGPITTASRGKGMTDCFLHWCHIGA